MAGNADKIDWVTGDDLIETSFYVLTLKKGLTGDSSCFGYRAPAVFAEILAQAEYILAPYLLNGRWTIGLYEGADFEKYQKMLTEKSTASEKAKMAMRVWFQKGCKAEIKKGILSIPKEILQILNFGEEEFCPAMLQGYITEKKPILIMV